MLAKLHGSASHAGERECTTWRQLALMLPPSPPCGTGAMPDMPHTVTEVGTGETRDFLPEGDKCEKMFDGVPQPLLPILRELMRFPRPLITWDLFRDPPPPTFPVHTAAAPGGPQEPPRAAAETARPRDPRTVNNVVHMDHTAAQHKRDRTDMDDEEWLDECPSRLEASDLRKDGLYIVRLEQPDGELALGLVLLSDLSVSDTEEDKIRAYWFERCSKGHHKWPAHVKFGRYGTPWVSDLLPSETFLMEVREADLTEAGAKARDEHPVLSDAFVKRLRIFAARDGLAAPQAPNKKQATAKPTTAEPADATPSAAAAAPEAARPLTPASRPVAARSTAPKPAASKPAAAKPRSGAPKPAAATSVGKKRSRS